MLRLIRFRVKKVVVWLDVDFHIQPGLILVRGPNRSGKTLLFRLLGHILRAQTLRRGSSLSRLPRGGEVSLEFQPLTGELWEATLTQSKLGLSRDREDQGSTGKRAPQQLLAQTLALPIELFDSTIHLQGVGDHPLVTGKPSQKLEWMAAVLDLTDAYERSAITLLADLERAELAAASLAELQARVAALESQVPTTRPATKRLRNELREARLDLEYFGKAERLLDQAADLVTGSTVAAWEKIIARTDKQLASLQKQLRQAEEYEANRERATRAAALRERLARLPVTLDVSPRALQLFADIASNLACRLADDQDLWEASAADRAAYENFCRVLDSAPPALAEKVEKTRTILAGAREQRRHLNAVHGPECPVCRAALDAAKKRELLDDATARENEAGARLTRLQQYTGAAEKVAQLQTRLAGLVEPSPVNFAPFASHLQRQAAAAHERATLRERLSDLAEAEAVTPAALDLDSATLQQMIAKAEAARTDLHINLDRQRRATEVRGEVTKLYGSDCDPAELRAGAADARAAVERLVVAVAEAEALDQQIDRLAETLDGLDQQIAKLKPAAAHLAELREMKEALGGRGLRLVKIEELAQAFQAEFNNLVPLLWDDPFVIEIEVKHTGLEIYATRNGVRDDLHALSGSEMKVWKLLTALCLIRLLPNRLRCNTIILDELEANMDQRTRERFVADYLPELRQYVDTVILVSPLSYQDLPLTPTTTYQITKGENVSRLVALNGAQNA